MRAALFASLILLAACATRVDPPVMSVFFVEDGAGLDTAARGVVTEAAGRAAANPVLPVRVLGFAAPDTGTAEFNRTLAQARAQGVADALAEAGVARSRIRVESRGATPFTMQATESRRVEIRIGL